MTTFQEDNWQHIVSFGGVIAVVSWPAASSRSDKAAFTDIFAEWFPFDNWPIGVFAYGLTFEDPANPDNHPVETGTLHTIIGTLQITGWSSAVQLLDNSPPPLSGFSATAYSVYGTTVDPTDAPHGGGFCDNGDGYAAAAAAFTDFSASFPGRFFQYSFEDDTNGITGGPVLIEDIPPEAGTFMSALHPGYAVVGEEIVENSCDNAWNEDGTPYYLNGLGPDGSIHPITSFFSFFFYMPNSGKYQKYSTGFDSEAAHLLPTVRAMGATDLVGYKVRTTALANISKLLNDYPNAGNRVTLDFVYIPADPFFLGSDGVTGRLLSATVNDAIEINVSLYRRSQISTGGDGNLLFSGLPLQTKSVNTTLLSTVIKKITCTKDPAISGGWRLDVDNP